MKDYSGFEIGLFLWGHYTLGNPRPLGRGGCQVKYVDGIKDNVAFLELVKTMPPSQKDLLFESMDSLGYGLQN